MQTFVQILEGNYLSVRQARHLTPGRMKGRAVWQSFPACRPKGAIWHQTVWKPEFSRSPFERRHVDSLSLKGRAFPLVVWKAACRLTQFERQSFPTCRLKGGMWSHTLKGRAFSLVVRKAASGTIQFERQSLPSVGRLIHWDVFKGRYVANSID